MDDVIRLWALRGALLLDAAATFVIVAAAAEAVVRALPGVAKPHLAATLRPIRQRLSEWLVLALELLIGSDIIRTAVSPSWTELGQLGAIVALRLIIDYSLLHEFKEGDREGQVSTPPT